MRERQGKVPASLQKWDSAIPKISVDYFFLGGHEMEATENPMLVILDEEKGIFCTRLLEHKGMGGATMSG